MAIKISGNTVIDDSQNITATGSGTFGDAVTVQGNTSAESVKLIGRSSDDRTDLQFYENDGSTFLASLSAQLDSLNLFLGSSSGELKITGNQTIFRSEIGTERARINSSGMGIGTTSPAATLHLNKSGTSDYTTLHLSNSGASGRSYQIGVGGNTAGAGYANNLYIYDNSAGQPRVVLDSSGNVKIGGTLSSPNINLNAGGSATFADNVQVQGLIGDRSDGATNGVFIGRNNGSETSRIRANGAAEFAGSVSATVGDFTGNVTSDRTSSSHTCFNGKLNGTTTSEILADGSATFAETITANGGVSFTGGQLVESVNVTAGTLASASDIDLSTGMVHYFTTQESTQVTPNLSVSGKSVNQIMAIGEAISVVIMLTASASGYMSSLTIDGSPVTPMWSNGIAPSEGGASGIDVYSLQVIKTANSTYTVIANSSNFA